MVFLLLCLTYFTQYDMLLLYSTWNSAQCCVADWMGRGFQGEWICVYV